MRTLQPVWYVRSIPSHSKRDRPAACAVELRSCVGPQHHRVSVEREVDGEDERVTVRDDGEAT